MDAIDFSAHPAAVRWVRLGLAALTVAVAAASGLVAARTPGLAGWVGGGFPRLLVAHVTAIAWVWTFAMAGALWTLHGRASRVAGIGAWLAIAGAAGMILAWGARAGPARLADYLPHLDGGFFLAALATFGLGVTVAAVGSIKRPGNDFEWALAWSRLPVLMAVLEVVQAREVEAALWGAGHLLQFSFVTLLMGLWWRGAGGAASRAVRALFALAALPACLPPLLRLAGWGDAGDLRAVHTAVMAWGAWPAPLALAVLLRRRAGRQQVVAMSMTIFLMGCLAGAGIGGQTTLIPAHYHGTLGALNLALMACLAGGRDATLRLYGVGQVLLIAGFAWSGVLGAARKLPLAAGADGMQLAAAGLIGVGGGLAILGVAWFLLRQFSQGVRSWRSRSSGAPTCALAP